MLIKIKLIFEGVFYILTSVSTLESVLFKHVLTQGNNSQKPTQMNFGISRLIDVMVRAHVHERIGSAPNTLVSASCSSSGAKM